MAAQSSFVQIEQYERYQKQSYRNRCTILSANGPLSLVVPVLRPHDSFIRDIRIDYSKPWQQLHWRAIEAAYRSAAFFEEYSAEIHKVYRKEVPFLFDLNISLWELSQHLLGISSTWNVSEQFMPFSNSADDYRFSIHPKAKHKQEGLVFQSYFQVFAHKFGFIPDLSILDLILNKGTLY
jgi:hypothetical protein